MDINILQLLKGAKAAEGLTVIIDVFRAFSVECHLFDRGAEKIIAVGDKEQAYRLKSENTSALLVGERNGVILPGFDFGNSPSQVSKADFCGRTAIHTTSAGTQGLANAENASEILGCSLVNAGATARYIKNSGAEKVSLVCMGWNASEPTEEDTLCAEYIESILLGADFDMKARLEHLRRHGGKKFFDPAQADVFPEEDFWLCTQTDRFDFAIKAEKLGESAFLMKKIHI